MKRISLGIIAIALSACLLSACSTSSSNNNEQSKSSEPNVSYQEQKDDSLIASDSAGESSSSSEEESSLSSVETSTDQSGDESNDMSSEPKKKYSYKIEDTYDTNVGTAIRMNLKVSSDEEYLYAMNDDEMSEMLKSIVDDYVSGKALNAVTVYLYCTGDDIDNAYTVACCTYAPEGDLSKAVEVSSGDYSSFDYDIQINSVDIRDILRG